jgi:excisionase family DNA binding protein
MSAVFTVPELAKYLSLSLNKVYVMTSKGEIPHLRMGGSIRYPVKMIEEWIAEKAELKSK